jgi:tRNA modification GTPase
MSDTICAISTATGNGAIALLRLSGNNAFEIIKKIFIPIKKTFSIDNAEDKKIIFGTIKDNNKIIDEVLISIFKSPNTFTGENIVEISCHGSLFIQQEILKLLIKNGARLALPGEFTQRAYLNGKMDLSQAEAVADIIASENEASHKIAINQMRGGFSNKLAELRKDLLQFISLIELELDFSEEDVEFADRTALMKLITNIESIISKLIKSFELGNAIKNGIPIAIVGEPNVGKSTLLNTILKEDKAIVSDIAGTTRDAIEDTFNYNGVQFRFTDTAGLRDTDDTIENLGIKRTIEKINQATVILALFNADDTPKKIKNSLKTIINKTENTKNIILVRNKIDETNYTPKFIDDIGVDTQINISAKNNINIDKLLQEIANITGINSINDNDVIVSNIRHIEALSLALDSLTRAKDGLNNEVSNDFLAMDVRETIHYLSGITGEEITTDEILGNIFGQFCIGK